MGMERINKYIAKNKCNKIKVMCHVIDKKKLTEFRWKYLIDSFDKDGMIKQKSNKMHILDREMLKKKIMYQSVIIPFPHRLLTKLAVIDICV
jgi:hypothetical protein